MTTNATAAQPPPISLLSAVAVVAVLYFGKPVLLPLVLAILFSFLLAPVIKRLERLHLGRVGAVLVATTLSFLLLGALAYVVVAQTLDLAQQLPSYRTNLLTKVQSLKASPDSPISHAVRTLEEVGEALADIEDAPTPGASDEAPPPSRARDKKQRAVPVEIVASSQGSIEFIKSMLLPLLDPLAGAAIVIVLVIFMLIGREDLRDRVIHLAGRGQLRVTTAALDEAGQRVSRYLLAQLIVNATYGMPVAVGLYFIGIPNAALWGLLTIVLRFLPYVGPWLGAAFPMLLSLAVSDDWTMPLLTLGLFVVMELISNNVIEPWLYGASTGLSPLSIIIAAVFWTWLWGPVGLVLATPLTVCVAVLGKHIAPLAWLHLLLGEMPPIAAADRLYQRLLAQDEEESYDLIEREVRAASLATAFDSVLLPAVRQVELDFRSGALPESARAKAFTLVRRLIAEFEESGGRGDAMKPSPVLCLPASYESDELAALMLALLLRHRGVGVEVLSSRMLAAEMVDAAAAHPAPLICISSVPPASVVSAASVARRLRARCPERRITIGVWPADEAEWDRRRERFQSARPDETFSSLERAAASLVERANCLPTSSTPASAAPDS
jgi:predicted PurR-regulated permease PerM/methylmalonyl-CoA mutase cobalamin-binding subunit